MDRSKHTSFPIGLNSAQRTGPALRVLIVDDSAFMRQALRTILSSDPNITIVGTAVNGKEGVEKAKLLKPDIVTLDIEMPIMDGLTALPQIKAAYTPSPSVLMCSTLTKAGSHQTLKALRLGAADFIQKDPETLGSQDPKVQAMLLDKIYALGMAARHRPAPPPPRTSTSKSGIGGHSANASFSANQFECIVIGSSTGGPPVLETLVGELARSANRPPIIIAQHMPALFTSSLAERLDELGKTTVLHAAHGMKLQAGTVYICPGGKQTQLVGRAGSVTLTVGDDPAGMLYKPCANVLFISASRIFTKRTLGVVCTGMGDDGMLGSKQVVAGGGMVWAQEGSTCVVYGMPKAVVEPGIATLVASPMELAAGLSSLSTGAFAQAA